MPRRIDLGAKVREIARHTGPLPMAAASPLAHFQHAVAEGWNLLNYIERKVQSQRHSTAVFDKYRTLLHAMILVHLVEVFERYLKETAAVCVDELARFVLDRRFAEFTIKGHDLAAHFTDGTLGRALCESDTWLDCADINDRFRKLLADPFEVGKFFLFPQRGQDPAGERHCFQAISILFQLRHTIVHNVGVLTPSDAVKLRVLSQEAVEAGRMLQPERDDVRHAKQFLDETAQLTNARIGQRLAELLTTLRRDHSMAIDSRAMADRLTEQFGIVLIVDSVAGMLPPP